jgi:hypothetical protein
MGNRLWVLLCALGCGVLVSGCATVVNGTTQKIGISSNPMGAEVMAHVTALAMYSLGWTIDREQSQLPYTVEAIALPSGWVQVTIGTGDRGQTTVRILSHIPSESARQLFEMIDKILERRGIITEI